MQSSITEHCFKCGRLMSLNDLKLNVLVDDWVCKDEHDCAEGISQWS